MYFKLSFKNVRKSLRDYLLYFLTLTFSVAVFYVFNSIEAQQAMLSISKSSQDILKSMTQIIGAISVFVSFILGFLIVYSNNFLIKRRKKELGLYMSLGMSKGKLSRILVMETMIIGVFALATGLLIGVFASQWLSLFTAKLFEVNLKAFTFIFSWSAFLKTILYFGIIFFVVMIMSTLAISRYKLIDLLTAAKQNEKPKLKNSVLTVILFILSIACLVAAYTMVLKNGIYYFDTKLLTEIILGIIGTFLFFASLSGFFLKLIQANKKRYFKGLNMFILRQINSRINTAHISISLICLMLFLAIGILSTGLGLNSALNQTLRGMLGYDVSFFDEKGGNIYESFKNDGIDFYNYTDKYVEFNMYNSTTLKNRDIIEPVRKYIPKEIANGKHLLEMPVALMRESDYNNLLRLKNKPAINLSGKAALYSSYSEDVKKALEHFREVKKSLSIENKEYEVYPQVFAETITKSLSAVFIIVPDEAVSTLKAPQTGIVFNCKGNRSAMQDKLVEDLEALAKRKDVKHSSISAITKNLLKESAAGVTVMISYISIYLGLIFMIASAAILALQQLSEVSDNRIRYSVLKKIGADDRLIKKALFDQTLIYFGMPLLLAFVHSIIGIKVATDAVLAVGNADILGSVLKTLVVIVAIYGAYFLATYAGCKGMILKNKKVD